ncbi:MAG: response regulator [Desulfamplus sp.]|nr:response regulator [Desulfamplus sp.]
MIRLINIKKLIGDFISFCALFFAAFLYIILSTNNIAFSFIGSVRFDHLTIEDGLSQNTINAIIQDQNGFMWFATQDGLNKYDGYSFTYFKNNPEDANSLSDNFIYDIAIDKSGIMWIGTRGQGLSRFDPKTEKFINYRYDANNSKGISDNFIKVVHIDYKGNIWLGTENRGLSCFISSTNTFVHYQYSTTNSQQDTDSLSNPDNLKNAGNPKIISGNNITAIYRDSKGILWVGTKQNGLNKITLDDNNNIESVRIYENGISNQDFSKDAKTSRDARPCVSTIPDNEITAIYEDKSNNIWFGMHKGGLAKISSSEINDNSNRNNESGSNATDTIKFYQHDSDNKLTISSNSVTAIYEDKKGRLWIGTENGINILDKNREKFQIFNQDITSDPDGLSYLSIMRIYEDKSGVLWIGTFLGGINKLSEKKFLHIKKDNFQENSLSSNSIWSMFEDQYGIVWIGTEDVGLCRFDRNLNQFTAYKHDPSNPKTISNNRVQTILEDSRGLFWVGTEDGLNLMDRQTGEFTRYYKDTPLLVPPLLNSSFLPTHSLDDSLPNKLSDSDIMKIYEDRTGLLWIATYNGGLNCFDIVKNKLTHYRHDSNIDNKNNESKKIGSDNAKNSLKNNQYQSAAYTYTRSINHDRVRTVMQDHLGFIWIGTENGLNSLDLKGGTFKSYKHDISNPDSLSNNRIIFIMEDSKQRIWLSTKNGLNLFNREKETFTLFSEKDGLCNNTIYVIIEDETNNLWLSTNKGLSRFNPNTKEFRNFTKEDGLQSNEFNIGAGFKNKNSELFFGGINGFNIFNPSKISDNPNIPEIVLTSFKIFDKEILPANALSSLPTIRLSYKDSFFSFEFAGLDYAAPHKNQYAYQLVGFDNGWINCGTRRYVSYTNLDGGKYTFKVKGSNNDGLWNESGVSIDLIIPPPPWKSWWAYLIYILTLICAVYTYIFFKKQEYERKLEVQKLHSEAVILKERTKHQEEVERITRHDMKTPLNSIIAFPQILLQDSYLSPLLRSEHIELIQSIKKSGYIMLNMINLSLDMLKMENKTYTLNAVNVDILEVIRKVVSDLRHLAGMKNVKFEILIKENLTNIGNNQIDNDKALITDNPKADTIDNVHTGTIKNKESLWSYLTQETRDAGENETFTILGEELLCYSMFANIIKNAVEASPEKNKITICLSNSIQYSPNSTASYQKPDDLLKSKHQTDSSLDKFLNSNQLLNANRQTEHAIIFIHNYGVVPASIRDTFFDKYATSGKKGGTGLGTYSAKLMAQTLGGSISMTTDETKGTTIAVLLKSAHSKELPPSYENIFLTNTSVNENYRDNNEINRDETNENKSIVSNSIFTNNLPKLKILIVEDDEYSRLILKTYLKEPSLIVDSAENGKIALEKAILSHYDLIFMDMEMPIMNGMEAVTKIREWEREHNLTNIIALPQIAETKSNQIQNNLTSYNFTKNNPIIIVALSAHDDNETRQKCINAGFNAYLTKPVSRDHIKQIFINYFVNASIDNLASSLTGNNKVEINKIGENNKNRDSRIEDNKTKIEDSAKLETLLSKAVDACEEYNPDAVNPFIQELKLYITESDFKNLTDNMALFNFDAVKSYLIDISKKFFIKKEEIYLEKDIYSKEDSNLEEKSYLKEESYVFEIDIDLEDLIPDFLSNKKAEIASIADKLTDKDYESIRKIGHKLKGGFNMYGFDKLGEICSMIEDAAKTHDDNVIKDGLTQLEASFEVIKITYVNK